MPAKLFLRKIRPAPLSEGFVGAVSNYLPLKLDICITQWGNTPSAGATAENAALLILKEHAQWTARVLLGGTLQVITLDPGDIIGVPVIHNPPGGQVRVRCLSLAYVVSPLSPRYPQAHTLYGTRDTAGVIMFGPLSDFQLPESAFAEPAQQAFWQPQ